MQYDKLTMCELLVCNQVEELQLLVVLFVHLATIVIAPMFFIANSEAFILQRQRYLLLVLEVYRWERLERASHIVTGMMYLLFVQK